MVVCRFKPRDSELREISSIVDQLAFGTAELPEVEKAAPSGGDPVNEEPSKLSSRMRLLRTTANTEISMVR